MLLARLRRAPRGRWRVTFYRYRAGRLWLVHVVEGPWGDVPAEIRAVIFWGPP